MSPGYGSPQDGTLHVWGNALWWYRGTGPGRYLPNGVGLIWWRLGGMVTSKSKSLEGLLNCSFQVSFPPWKPTSRIHPYPSFAARSFGRDGFGFLLTSAGLTWSHGATNWFVPGSTIWWTLFGTPWGVASSTGQGEEVFMQGNKQQPPPGVLGFAHVSCWASGFLLPKVRSLWALKWW